MFIAACVREENLSLSRPLFKFVFMHAQKVFLLRARKDMCYLAIPRVMGAMYKAEIRYWNTKSTMRNFFHIYIELHSIGLVFSLLQGCVI